MQNGGDILDGTEVMCSFYILVYNVSSCMRVGHTCYAQGVRQGSPLCRPVRRWFEERVLKYFGAYLAHVKVLYIKMFAASRPLTVTCTQLQVCTCCACKRAHGGSFYLTDMHTETQRSSLIRNESEQRGVVRCLIVSFQHYLCLLHDNLLKQ